MTRRPSTVTYLAANTALVNTLKSQCPPRHLLHSATVARTLENFVPDTSCRVWRRDQVCAQLSHISALSFHTSAPCLIYTRCCVVTFVLTAVLTHLYWRICTDAIVLTHFDWHICSDCCLDTTIFTALLIHLCSVLRDHLIRTAVFIQSYTYCCLHTVI